MKYKSVFDIIGPVMVGPSSSHTAGAARIGRVARMLFGRQPKQAEITFYGSFAKTYKGHGSDVATVAGILHFDTFDTRLKDSLRIAKDVGVDVIFLTSEELTDHPNTARIRLSDENGSAEIVGVSIGGGKIEITCVNGFPLKLSGNEPTLLVLHEDRYGMIASVAQVLAKYETNIGHMEVSRGERGAKALMVIEVDLPITAGLVRDVEQIPHILGVSVLSPEP
ncbi:L-serine ammonia-lyase, iron-sulfur-dependent subunit beta [Brevibacillus sp. B_LB10_24]|uniref:L-serine ammonia-lyase, iron-sulfur-dependent subunit beta n=1 Tax=Brevibacillus sp. B_LB10_24 TaxID=3380645 RepID=UPI0038BB469D